MAGAPSPIPSSGELLKSLECPVCMEVPEPPILLCETGHFTCNNCREKCETCPTCKCNFSQVRNYLAEQILEKFLLTCNYWTEGCKLRGMEMEVRQHEKICPFRPFECYLSGTLHACKGQKISYGNFGKHVRIGHKIQGVESNVGVWVENATPEVMTLAKDQKNQYCYLQCYQRMFLAASETVASKIMWWVYIVGSKKDASNFTAKIKMENIKTGVKMYWKGPVHSIRTASDIVFNSGLGLMVSKENMKPLTNYLPDSKLYQWRIGYTIFQAGESTTPAVNVNEESNN